MSKIWTTDRKDTIDYHNISSVTGGDDNQDRHGLDVNVLNDYWVQHTYNVIQDGFGDEVRIKPKNLLKFGHTTNADSGEETTIMTLAGAERHETYVNANIIDRISSSDDTDTQTLSVEGHTIANSTLAFIVQSVTLAGQSSVALATSLTRTSRVLNKSPADIVGPVFIYEDGAVTNGVPDTDASVHLIVAAGHNTSEKASTSFSNVDYGVITSMSAALSQGQTLNADFELQIREFGMAFLPQFQMSLRTTSGIFAHVEFRPHIIVPKNADVRIVATASANNSNLFASWNSLIAVNQD